jgi:DNA-binding beta-propeller fold protein YncE
VVVVVGLAAAAPSALASVSPLRSFGGVGSAAGDLNLPAGVAFDANGDVFVADTDNQRIDEFDSTRDFVRAWGVGVVSGTTAFQVCISSCQQGTAATTDGGMFAPTGVAYSATTGDLYVADSRNNRVDEFTTAGGFVRSWGEGVTDGASTFEVCTDGCQAGIASVDDGALDHPQAIAVDGAGNVWVTDTLGNRLEQYSSSGSFIRAVGGAGTQLGQFNDPIGIAVAPSGDGYVVDGQNARVEQFSPSTGPVRAWGWGVDDGGAALETCTIATGCRAGTSGGGTGQLDYPAVVPAGIAVDADGNVDVTDFENDRVNQYTATGGFVRSWGWGVADGTTAAFATCASSCDPGLSGSGLGQLFFPEGLAIGESGQVVVTNYGSDLAQEYSNPRRTLSVTLAGTGTGTVSGGPISCPGTCAAAVDTGSTVTLTATAGAYSTFSGWTGGGCSGTGTCMVTVGADTPVTATFAAAPPVISSCQTNGVDDTEAQLVCLVNPEGSDTHYQFTVFGTPVTTGDAGSDGVDHVVTFDLGHLTPMSPYPWSLTATNAGGTTTGPTVTATTLAAPGSSNLGPFGGDGMPLQLTYSCSASPFGQLSYLGTLTCAGTVTNATPMIVQIGDLAEPLPDFGVFLWAPAPAGTLASNPLLGGELIGPLDIQPYATVPLGPLTFTVEHPIVSPVMMVSQPNGAAAVAAAIGLAEPSLHPLITCHAPGGGLTVTPLDTVSCDVIIVNGGNDAALTQSFHLDPSTGLSAVADVGAPPVRIGPGASAFTREFAIGPDAAGKGPLNVHLIATFSAQTSQTPVLIDAVSQGLKLVTKAFAVGAPSTATLSVPLACPDTALCRLSILVTTAAADAGKSKARAAATQNLGSLTVTLQAGHTTHAKVRLNATGRRLLRSSHTLRARVRITQTIGSGKPHTIVNHVITLTAR